MRRRLRVLGAVSAVAAVLVALTVPAVTTAAWHESTAFTAHTSVAGVTPPPSAVPPLPGPSTVVSNVVWKMPPVNNQQNTCVEFDVSATSGSWSVSFPRDQAPLWGHDNMWVEGGNVSQTVHADRIVFTGTGSPHARICTNSPSNPPVSAGRFTTSASSPVWTTDRACFALTVRGTQDPTEYPFFFGWDAVLDLRAATQLVIDNGKAPTSLSLPDGGTLFSSSEWRPGTEHVTLTSTTQGAIGGMQERIVMACLLAG